MMYVRIDIQNDLDENYFSNCKVNLIIHVVEKL